MSQLKYYLGISYPEPSAKSSYHSDGFNAVKAPRWFEKLQKKFRGADIYEDEWYVTDVVSSNLERMAYNYDKGLMAIQFLSGKMYLYGMKNPVPPDYFEDLVNPPNRKRSHGVEFYALFRRHNQDARDFGYEMITRFPEE